MCKASSEIETQGFQAQIQPRLNMEFQADVDCVDTPCPKGIPAVKKHSGSMWLEARPVYLVTPGHWGYIVRPPCF